MNRPSLRLTASDARRLDAVLQGAGGLASPMAPLLEQELARAHVVADADIPADVVTMNSRVVCLDESSGERHEIELVYPHEADVDRGRVSVLAPVGAALLGLSAGSCIDWPLPGGRTTRVRVIAVPFQPEAARRIVKGS
jgi:regulator of nucleoside diphosphate kinase